MRQAPIDMNCAHCGEPYKMHAYRLKNGNGKYCGQSCYLAARWHKSGQCESCGDPCKDKQQRFCCEQCRKDYWNKNSHKMHKHPSHWRRKLALIKGLGGKCVRCGIGDIRALQINHIDPTKKVRPKDGQWTWSRRFKDWEANKGNLELLCANCHSIHTWEQRGFGPAEDHSNPS